MRTIFAVATVVWLGCNPLQAQSTILPPSGMGATSPLSIPGMSSTGMMGATGMTLPALGSTGTGIPLGATEINRGGLSPMPGGCGSTVFGGTGAGGVSSSMSGTTSMASGCPTASTTAISGVGVVPSLGTTGSTVRPIGIPFGSTEVNSGGVSPMLTVPPPTTTTPCVGANGMTTGMQAPGTVC